MSETTSPMPDRYASKDELSDLASIVREQGTQMVEGFGRVDKAIGNLATQIASVPKGMSVMQLMGIFAAMITATGVAAGIFGASVTGILFLAGAQSSQVAEEGDSILRKRIDADERDTAINGVLMLANKERISELAEDLDKLADAFALHTGDGHPNRVEAQAIRNAADIQRLTDLLQEVRENRNYRSDGDRRDRDLRELYERTSPGGKP